MSTELILIRHGNTIRVNGDYFHAPLTSLGELQAAQTGEYLSEELRPLGGIYTNPLRRAKGTAAIISSKLGQTPEVKDGIQDVEGLEVPALAVLESLSILDFVEDYLDAHAGKPIRWPVEGRVSKTLLEITEAHPNQRTAVVTHGGEIHLAVGAKMMMSLPDYNRRSSSGGENAVDLPMSSRHNLFHALQKRNLK